MIDQGIVRDLSPALAARGINVVELETECVSAPWTGRSSLGGSGTLFSGGHHPGASSR